MIHSTAIVHPEAQVGDDVSIGAYSIIDGPATIGAGCKIYPHVYISGWTRLGARCEVHPFAVIGGDPQDLKFEACDSYLQIGDGTAIREYVTIHRSSHQDGTTRIGNNCMLMAKSHIAHDCALGDGVIIVNNTECAGHVHIDDNAFVSGHTLIHQFTRIGRRALITPLGRIRHDIPPFVMTDYEGAVARVNVVGLRRENLPREVIQQIKEAFKLLYRSGKPFMVAVAELKGQEHCAEVRELVEFISADSKCGIAGPPNANIARAQRGDEHSE